MFKYKIKIAYDGTNYSGWQEQLNSESIQSLIEKALSTILRTYTSIAGSGRTDAGVHALAQVAHFVTEKSLDKKKTLFSLNALLPSDIRILDMEEVAPSFHARYSATSKTYHYHLHLDSSLNPFKRLYSYHVPHKVDLDLLKEAAKYFVGKHDFSSFAHKADQGSAAKDPVRTIYRLDIIEEEGGVRLEFEGEGFLHKMVRNITGTLLDISRRKIPLEELPKIFEAKDRKKAGLAAPAEGLFLIKVTYP